MAQEYTKKIRIHDSAEHLFQLWSNYDNFPHFMKHIKSVSRVDAHTSHWVMKGPLGSDVEWDARVTEYDPHEKIAWESVGGDISTHGRVEFHEISPGETEVTLMMAHSAPGGKVGEVVAKLIRDPEKQLEEDLKNFKEFAESATARSSL